ncbi:hypothetical protein [Phytopseudomonas punonensis]|uniref:hypothetical protein n=1 Tax=Phytopseudomonas punonensis TaxID=1220495 RepID=UPI001114870D|nr:hypothetical protein [Pseudomonas punonensis]
MTEYTTTMTILAPELLILAAGFSLFGIAILTISRRQRSVSVFLASVLLMFCAAIKVIKFLIMAFIPMQCPNGQCNPTELNQQILNTSTLAEPYLFLAAAICMVIYTHPKRYK